MGSLLERLKRRKLFQWALAYLAGAWLAIQVVDVLGEQFLWSLGIQRGITAALGVGFPLALVLAWYHGEKGRQRVSGPEFVILTSLVVLAGVVLTVVDPFGNVEPAGTMASAEFIGPNSIVVLPFVNMSSDPEQEYMSDGIAEELLNLLSQIPELKVISRTSAFSFKGRDDLTIPEIAAQLGVAHVLEGSVRKAGNTIRITAQLIDPRSDVHLFSETYDRALDDIFAIQDEIAAKVVSELRVTLLGELPQQRKTDPEAYTLFLRARHMAEFATAGPESLQGSIRMVERVLEIDPDFAPAYVALARAYSDQVEGGELPFEEGVQMAVDAVQRALSLDPDYTIARVTLGVIQVRQGDVVVGARQLQRAFELVPTDPESLMMAGMALGMLGRFDESAAVLEYVADLDPLSPVILLNLSTTYMVAGRWGDLATTSRTVLELNPSAMGANGLLSVALLKLGEFEEALAAAESEPIPPLRLVGVALASYALGREAEFESAFRELQEGWGEEDPGSVAEVYAFTGDVDAAFELLEGVTPDISTISDPFFSNLHDDPRWTAWLERMDPSVEQLAAIPFEVRLRR